MFLFLYSPSLSLCRASSRGAGSRQVLRPLCCRRPSPVTPSTSPSSSTLPSPSLSSFSSSSTSLTSSPKLSLSSLPSSSLPSRSHRLALYPSTPITVVSPPRPPARHALPFSCCRLSAQRQSSSSASSSSTGSYPTRRSRSPVGLLLQVLLPIFLLVLARAVMFSGIDGSYEWMGWLGVSGRAGGVVVVGGVRYLLIEQMQPLFFYCVLYIVPMRGTYKHLAKIIN